MLRGPSAKDLAFLAGRHLTYYRPEYHVLIYYPTREELTNLLLAAVQIAMPEPTSPGIGAPVRALHARMERRISKEDREALGEAVALARRPRRPRGARRLDTERGAHGGARGARALRRPRPRRGHRALGDACGRRGAPGNEERRSRRVLRVAGARDLRARFATTAPESLRPAPSTSGVHIVV